MSSELGSVTLKIIEFYYIYVSVSGLYVNFPEWDLKTHFRKLTYNSVLSIARNLSLGKEKRREEKR